MEFQRWSKDGSFIPKRSEMRVLPPELSVDGRTLPNPSKGSIDGQRAVSIDGLHDLLLHAGEVLQREDGDILADGQLMQTPTKSIEVTPYTHITIFYFAILCNMYGAASLARNYSA
jgi:hypothetical protein